MSSSEVNQQLVALRSSVDALVAGDAEVSEKNIQDIMTAAVQLYAAKVTNEGDFPAVTRGTITATDAMITTTALLRAVNVQVFELGLWQSWAH
jgi:hypothetical protein